MRESFEFVTRSAPAPDGIAGNLRRLAMPLERLTEQEPELSRIHAIWASLRGQGRLPAPKALLALLPGHAASAHVIMVGERGQLGSPTRIRTSAPDRDMDPIECAELIPALWAAMRDDFATVAFTGSPAYHRVIARVGPSRLVYGRLILPLAGNGFAVDTIVTCVGGSFLERIGLGNPGTAQAGPQQPRT